MYDRETLYEEVWEEIIPVVAKRYSISEYKLRSVCKSPDIPLPDRVYWVRRKAGIATDKPKLPKLKEPKDENMPEAGNARTLQIGENALAFLKDEDRKALLVAAGKLRVTGPGAQLHKDIAAHKENCERWLKRRVEGSGGL